jgi:hypothetical protein
VVSSATASVAFAAAKFGETAPPENATARAAVLRRKGASGDLLMIVARTAKVVREHASDTTFVPLARAAR